MQQAFARGALDAQYHLALNYGEGNGVPQNIPRAMELCKAAAGQGHPAACAYLSVLQLREYTKLVHGYQQNLDAAKKTRRKAQKLIALKESSPHLDMFQRCAIDQAKKTLKEPIESGQIRCHNQACAFAPGEPRPDIEKLKACARCLQAQYCSTDCQTQDWQCRHKLVCRQLADARKAV